MRTKEPIGIPNGTRLQLIERVLGNGWLVWTSRSPCGEYGSYLKLNDDGSVESWTIRLDGDDELIEVKDKE